MKATAVVFAYHDVGVQGLSVLLEQGVDVQLVVTHREDPSENAWFASVEHEARARGLRVALPDSSDDPALLETVRSLAPDFIFSFYYRQMLAGALLACARRGAYNLHGSLLPRYRGRAPVNWAVLHGERETGATLHVMTDKPDAGPLVEQQAVPIGEDETAAEVMRKVTRAAAEVLARSLPSLVAGRANPVAQDPTRASYFGARRPEDGRIDWARPAREIHNLVRAVAPPYPGAFTTWGGRGARILRSRLPNDAPPASAEEQPGHVHCHASRTFILCAGQTWLEVLSADIEGGPMLEGAALCAFFAGAQTRMGQSTP